MSALASLPRPRWDFEAQISANGSTWRNLCAQMVDVQVEGQKREFAFTPRACGGSLVTAGPKGPVVLHLRFLFTELTTGADGAWQTLRGQWEASDDPLIYVRYRPRASVGDDADWYATADGDGDEAAASLTELLYPRGSQIESPATPFIAGATVVCANLAVVAYTAPEAPE